MIAIRLHRSGRRKCSMRILEIVPLLGIFSAVMTAECQTMRGDEFRESQRCATLAHGKDIAGLCFDIKIQFDIPGIELRQYRIDAAFNRRMVSAVTGDKLLDHGLEGRGRKKCVRYKHQDCTTKAAKWRITRVRLESSEEMWTSDA